MNKKPEKEFQNAFAQLAQYMGCTLETIPDIIPQKTNGVYKKFVAHRRFCDAVLITPLKVYCLEFKYQHGCLMPHQENTGRRINNVNKQAYFIVRKKVLKSGVIYSIENYQKEKVYSSGRLEAIIHAFMER